MDKATEYAANVAANTSMEEFAVNNSMDDETERSDASDAEQLESEATSIFNDIEDHRIEPREHSGIPVHTSDVGSSLPTAEEIRHDAAKQGKVPTTRNRWLKLILAVTVCLAILFGVAIGVSGRKNNETQPATYEENVEYLQENSVSSAAAFLYPDSPSVRAAQWLTDQNLPLPQDESAAYKHIVRYVMALNYYALGGASWNFDLQFLDWSDVCKFKGIILDGTDPITKGGVHCNHNDEPIYLELSKFVLFYC